MGLQKQVQTCSCPIRVDIFVMPYSLLTGGGNCPAQRMQSHIHLFERVYHQSLCGACFVSRKLIPAAAWQPSPKLQSKSQARKQSPVCEQCCVHDGGVCVTCTAGCLPPEATCVCRRLAINSSISCCRRLLLSLASFAATA